MVLRRAALVASLTFASVACAERREPDEQDVALARQTLSGPGVTLFAGGNPEGKGSQGSFRRRGGPAAAALVAGLQLRYAVNVVQHAESPPPLERPRYLGPPTPIVFPEEAKVPETQVHFELRILLYQLLCDHLGLEATVGSDQFVYYDAADPARCVAPDIYVQLKPASDKIRSWKTWERGAPDLALEIVSRSDAPEIPWAEKLRRYQSVGVRELIRFDVEATKPEAVLRIWDRVEGALLERDLRAAPGSSFVLDLTWVVAPADDHAIALRITTGRSSDTLVPTRIEARKAEAEARKAEAEARKAAEDRVHELEAELKRRS